MALASPARSHQTSLPLISTPSSESRLCEECILRQVLRAGALGRPRGMGWEREAGEGWGWGTHVNPWLIHVNVWQKPLQYCKVVSLQLIKINEKIKLKKKNHASIPSQAHGRKMIKLCAIPRVRFSFFIPLHLFSVIDVNSKIPGYCLGFFVYNRKKWLIHKTFFLKYYYRNKYAGKKDSLSCEGRTESQLYCLPLSSFVNLCVTREVRGFSNKK